MSNPSYRGSESIGFASPTLIRTTRMVSILASIAVALYTVAIVTMHLNDFQLSNIYPLCNINHMLLNSIALFFLSLSIFVLNYTEQQKKTIYIGDLFSSLSLIVGIVTFVLFFIPLVIDFQTYQLSVLSKEAFQYRESITLCISIGIIFLSFSAISFNFRNKRWMEVYQYGSLICIFFASISFSIFIFDEHQSLFPLDISNPIGLFLALSFCLWALAIATLMARPRTGIMKLLTNDNMAGKVARRMFCFTLISPLLVGVIINIISKVQNVSLNLKATSFSIILILSFSLVIYLIVKYLEREELESLTKELTLERAFHRMERMFYNAADGIIVMDNGGYIQYSNDTSLKWLGYKESDIKGKSVLILIPPVLIDKYKNFYDEYLNIPTKKNIGKDFDFHVLRKDGTTFPADIMLSPIQYEDQAFVMISMRDVSDHQKKSQYMLRQMEKLRLSEFEAVMANQSDSPFAMAPIFMESICKYANWSMGHFLVYSNQKECLVSSNIFYKNEINLPDSNVKKNISYSLDKDSEILKELDRNEMVLWYNRSVIAEDILPEVFSTLEFGTHVYMPIMDEDKIYGLIEFFARDCFVRDEDMTTLLENSASQFAKIFHRKQEKDKAANSLKAREETLARVSHDLQNPLGTILASNEVLSLMAKSCNSEKLDKDFQNFTEIINKSVKVMQSFIKDLLDFSKMEAGSFKITPQKINPIHIVQEAIDLVQLSAKAQEINLEKYIMYNHTRPIMADREMILRALLNLLNNAIKFSEKGSRILISLREHHEMLEFAVTDYGPGIDEESKKLIFNSYWQVDESNTQGTGLGLAITKGITEAHGGRVDVKSKLGEGSTFCMYLPIIYVPQENIL